MARILIVEDEPTVLLLAESILLAEKHETLSASTGAQAIALLDGGTPIDALITDINIGEGPDGLAVAADAASRHPTLPVVYASAMPLTDGLKAQLVERSVFLAKPYDGPELIRALDRAMAGGD